MYCNVTLLTYWIILIWHNCPLSTRKQGGDHQSGTLNRFLAESFNCIAKFGDCHDYVVCSLPVCNASVLWQNYWSNQTVFKICLFFFSFFMVLWFCIRSVYHVHVWLSYVINFIYLLDLLTLSILSLTTKFELVSNYRVAWFLTSFCNCCLRPWQKNKKREEVIFR